MKQVVMGASKVLLKVSDDFKLVGKSVLTPTETGKQQAH